MEIIAAVGFIATLLGVCMAISGYFHKKYMKSEAYEVGKMIDGIENVLNEIRRRRKT